MSKFYSPSLHYTLIVSLGGFIFGFDASVISGAITFIKAEFALSDWQQGIVVSSPTLGALIAMIFAGAVSDAISRRNALLLVAVLYIISAACSAAAPTFELLVLARFVGGVAFCSLIIAPMYISEISTSEHRGKMVSVNQLNIVLGFATSYFTNYHLLQLSHSDMSWVAQVGIHSYTWRYMLGLEVLPALLWLGLLLTVPRSPRWLMLKGKHEEAKQVIAILFDKAQAQVQLNNIESSLSENTWSTRERFGFLAAKAMRFPLIIGVILAIAQQITGINVIFFYAPTIFEQSGIGTDAAFMQAVWIGIVNVVFTVVAMITIDRWGRRPLLIVGLCGVIVSMAICAYGFNNATYTLTDDIVLTATQNVDSAAEKVFSMVDETYYSDVSFNHALRNVLSSHEYNALQQPLLNSSISMNAPLVLFGILAFVASFAVSLGPVMWAMLAEIYPNQTRGLAISLVGVINALTSFFVQLIFPWELVTFGAALTFALYGLFAVISLFLVVRYFPETKGKTLEEISQSFRTRTGETTSAQHC